MTIMTVASRLIDYIFHSDMGEEEIFDPTSISNGGWDQKLDHLPGLIYSSCCQNRDRNRNYFFYLFKYYHLLRRFETNRLPDSLRKAWIWHFWPSIHLKRRLGSKVRPFAWSPLSNHRLVKWDRNRNYCFTYLNTNMTYVDSREID
jgi:hypothetical protein